MGDGFFATFSTDPRRRPRRAIEITTAVHALGLEIRAGCTRARSRSRGSTRISADSRSRSAPGSARLAGSSEVLVSPTVKDLAAGFRLAFEDAGRARTQGCPRSLAPLPSRQLTHGGTAVARNEVGRSPKAHRGGIHVVVGKDRDSSWTPISAGPTSVRSLAGSGPPRPVVRWRADEEDAAVVDVPETRYAKTADGVHIAYQVLGEGPFDFVFVNSAYVSNVEIGVWGDRTASPTCTGGSPLADGWSCSIVEGRACPTR